MFSFKFSSFSARQCLSYVSSCINSLKNSINEYQVYATGYDEPSTRYYVTDSQYDSHHVPPRITQEMEVLMNSYVSRRKRLEIMAKDLSKGIANSVVYGAFVMFNFIGVEKKAMKDYLFQMGGYKSQAKANDGDVGVDLSAAVLHYKSAWYPATFADAIKDGSSLSTEDPDDVVLVEKPDVPLFDDGWAFVDKNLSFADNVSIFTHYAIFFFSCLLT